MGAVGRPMTLWRGLIPLSSASPSTLTISSTTAAPHMEGRRALASVILPQITSRQTLTNTQAHRRMVSSLANQPLTRFQLTNVRVTTYLPS